MWRREALDRDAENGRRVPCVQGQLDKCKQIDLNKWKSAASKDVNEIAKKAKHRADVDNDKKKHIALKKINQVMKEKQVHSKAEIKAEHRVQKEANRLTKEITENKRLNPHEKMTSIAQVKDEVRDIIADIHGGKKVEALPASSKTAKSSAQSTSD